MDFQNLDHINDTLFLKDILIVYLLLMRTLQVFQMQQDYVHLKLITFIFIIITLTVYSGFAY